jgi:xylulokinase
LIPKSDELVAWGAAAQAAGILIGEPAVEVARRWRVSEGPRIPAQPLDAEAIERIARVREAAHELTARELFPDPDPDPDPAAAAAASGEGA